MAPAVDQRDGAAKVVMEQVEWTCAVKSHVGLTVRSTAVSESRKSKVAGQLPSTSAVDHSDRPNSMSRVLSRFRVGTTYNQEEA